MLTVSESLCHPWSTLNIPGELAEKKILLKSTRQMPRRRVGHTDLSKERCHRRVRRDPSVRCGRCGGHGQEDEPALVATDKGDAVANLEVWGDWRTEDSREVLFSWLFLSLCSIITCSRDQTTSTDTAISTCACIGHKLVSKQHRRRRHAVERSVAHLCWSVANVGPEAVYRIDGLSNCHWPSLVITLTLLWTDNLNVPLVPVTDILFQRVQGLERCVLPP